ncbi:TetR/AcrR family transcriptional regulator [Nonomuraea sp. NPDC050663]|uniref:TetR/AcrR family transcriptional regulator n=1 Tax=Nonomuraea sp. NPDC050663 TaxID=3364370 RepID=UPI0037BD6F69
MSRLTRKEQQAANRLKLLEAAETVFAERGIQGASLDEVALAAGLTKGAVYSNFSGKEELVLAVMRHRMGEEAQEQAARELRPGRDAGELVEEFGAFWAESASGKERYARLVLEFMVHATRDPATREQLRDLLFPEPPASRHPLAPPGSALARLPPGQADAILKALEAGMSLMTMLDPERCPPELFGVALKLLSQ